MSSKKGNTEVKKDNLTGLYVLLIVIFIIWLISAFLIQCNFNDWNSRGTFGDSFGAVNSLFSGLALAGIIFTIYLQKKELGLQREELRETRNEFITQNKTLRLQLFDNTFFNMLKVHQELRKEISFDTGKNGIFGYNEIIPDETVKGKSFFEFAQNDFTNLWKYEYDDSKINNIFDKISNRHKEYGYKYEPHSALKISDSEGNFIDKPVNEHLKDIIELKYPIFWKNYSNHLGDYFRNIYHILKYISDEKEKELETANDTSKKNMIKEKYKKYADILQSQMSYSELFFMFYNAQTYTNVKRFIEEFDFVENLFVKNLLHPKHAEFEGMGSIKEE